MKLLALTVNKNDTTSFYRANGVLGELKNQIEIEITSLDFAQLKNISWANLVLYDAVFMQRPYQSVALQLAQYCKELNLPLWVDFDDHLLEIPIDNQKAYNVFHEKQTKQTIVQIIGLADVVSVSTGALKTAFSTLNSNIKVIPNAINLKMLDYRTTQTATETVLWRGSDTHQLDIFIYAEEIYPIQHKYTAFEFIYFGFYPWFIPMDKNVKYIPPIDPLLYFKQLYTLRPKIMHVPLHDSVFNRCKSNIAFIEATFAGAVCLVPEWEEWTLPGAVTYNSTAQYAEKLELLLNNKINIKKRVQQAWDFISQNLSLNKVNQLRIDLINEIFK